jgi:subtilisin family serine protease
MRIRKPILLFAVTILAALAMPACMAGVGDPEVLGEDEAALDNVPPGHSFVPGELLIQFQPGLTEAEKLAAYAKIHASVKEKIHTQGMKMSGAGELHLASLPAGLAVADAARDLDGTAGVLFAEPNYIYTHDAMSNDPYYTNGSLWGMYGDATSPANAYGSQAGEAWNAGHTGSDTVYVGVIDEGIQWTHADLNANVWANPYEDPDDGIDNDGNGYVDDVHGWDFVGNNNSVYDGGVKGRRDKHGTHVAGTIGAVGNNGAGVAGVNWNVTIISCKFLGIFGGTTANAIKAVDYVTDLKTRHGIDLVATNNSWGGGGFSQALKDAIGRANEANILFIAAAGNGGSDGVGDNNDSVAHYPSNYDNANVIAVAALTSGGAKASYSNYGATTVDIAAPGSGVYSTLPPNTYGSYTGTSMATPHVTGGAALLAAYNSSRGAALKTYILGAATETASMAGKCVTNGRLNVSGF